MVSDGLLRALRRDLGQLVEIADNDLQILFRDFDTVEAAAEALRDVLPRLAQIYGDAAVELGADWYDRVREELGVRGSFRAVPGPPVASGSVDALAGYVTAQADSVPRMYTMTAAGMQKRIADASRGSVMGSSVEDRATAGWQRMGSGSCGFCAMLIGRGAIYSEKSVRFGSHDSCQCQAVPILKGAEPLDVRRFQPSKRSISEADQERARIWIRENVYLSKSGR